MKLGGTTKVTFRPCRGMKGFFIIGRGGGGNENAGGTGSS